MDVNLHSSERADELSARRFKRLLIAILVANFALLSLHRGEFWPFSRFTMFSRSGKAWARPLLRELSAQEVQLPLGEVWENQLPGRAFPVHDHHINQDDLAQVVRPTVDGLNQEQANFLARYFSDVRAERQLVLYAVHGSFRRDGSVRVRFRPLARIGPDGVLPLPVDAAAERWAP